MLSKDQAEKLQEIAVTANAAGLNAIDTLSQLIDKLTTVKTMANHARWRLASITQPPTAPIQPVKHIHQVTKAEGLVFYGIKELFYLPAMAARHIHTNEAKIVEAIEAGKLYSLIIHGNRVIPESILEAYAHAGQTSNQTTAV